MKPAKQFDGHFTEVVQLIRKARFNAIKNVNKELIGLYWKIGNYISRRIENEEWGKSVVSNLSVYLQKTLPDSKGYSSRNLWRMKQFYETYCQYSKLSTLLRELGWSSHLHIMSKSKSIEEREFYIRLAIKERYSVRELERQIDSGYYERVMLSKKKALPVLTQIHPDLTNAFAVSIECT